MEVHSRDASSALPAEDTKVSVKRTSRHGCHKCGNLKEDYSNPSLRLRKSNKYS